MLYTMRMSRTIVGVLRGGTSSEYDLSLKTGAAMISALPEERYDPRDIFIDKRGLWHARGVAVTPLRALSQVDVVLNALHGGGGEDGTVARLLERAGIPYAGSRPLAAGLALNKARARQLFIRAGLRLPRGLAFRASHSLTTGEMARTVFERFGPPYVVKPPSEGASRGIRIAAHLIDLPDALGDVLDAYGAALVEEFIQGKEASVGIIENFRGERFYALPPAQTILPVRSRMIEHSHHQQDLLRHVVPSAFTDAQKSELISVARAAHQALGLSHFSRADLIVAPRHIYLLEVNANPGMYPSAVFPQMLGSVGSSTSEFLEHSIGLARAA